MYILCISLDFFWKLKAQPNNELDEEERILGHLEDFQRNMVIYCNASQSFYDENPELFYSPTLEDVDEILTLEKIPIDFYQNIAIDCFFCEDFIEDISREEGLN